MKTASKTIITTVAAAGFALVAAAAYAFPPGGGGGGCGYGGGPGMGGWGGGPAGMGYGPGMGAGFQGDFAATADARLAYLKSTLKITDSQQAAWDAYAAKVKEQAGTMVAMRAQMFASAQSSPTDRITQHTELMKQRIASLEAVNTAFKDLYGSLSAEQKAVADQGFGGWRMAQGGPRGYGPGSGMRGYGPRW